MAGILDYLGSLFNGGGDSQNSGLLTPAQLGFPQQFPTGATQSQSGAGLFDVGGLLGPNPTPGSRGIGGFLNDYFRNLVPANSQVLQQLGIQGKQADITGKQLANTGAGIANQGASLNLIPQELQTKAWQSLFGQQGNTPAAAQTPNDQAASSSGAGQMPQISGPSATASLPAIPPLMSSLQPPTTLPGAGRPQIPLTGKSPMPGLPPGWTPLQAMLAGPGGLSAAIQKFSGPQNVRPGGALPVYNFATGNYDSQYQQPAAPPPGFNYNAGTNSLEPINHGIEAVQAGEAAASGGKAAGELPYQTALAQLNAGLTRGTEAYKQGLANASDLVPSYDPVTQKTTMVTKADALRMTQGGAPVQAPPPGASPPQPGNIGMQADGTYKTPTGTIIPPAPKPTRTAGGFQSAPSAADAATQSIYGETIKGWNDSVQPAAQAEERFVAMGQALKQIESGAWAEHKADIAANLIASGVFNPDTVKSFLSTDPAQAQIVLKNNFSAALSQLSAGKLGRITQNEIFALQKNLANPSLQPAANLAIIGQGIGIARYQQGLANDWNTARQLGYSDPLTYQQQWMKSNPLQKFIDNATKEVGPLKGMQGAAGVPTAIKSEADYQKLPSGAHYIDPNGVRRVKQ